MRQIRINQMLKFSTIIILIVSLILSKRLNDPTLFSRSGSLITLLGIIMEYRRIMLIDKANKFIPGTQVSLAQTRGLFNISPEDKTNRLIGNIIVIIGTIIWGYGDLFV